MDVQRANYIARDRYFSAVDGAFRTDSHTHRTQGRLRTCNESKHGGTHKRRRSKAPKAIREHIVEGKGKERKGEREGEREGKGNKETNKNGIRATQIRNK